MAMSTSLRMPCGSVATIVSRNAVMSIVGEHPLGGGDPGRRLQRPEEARPALSLALTATSRLSSTLSSGNSCGIWNDRQIPMRITWRGLSLVMSRSRK